MDATMVLLTGLIGTVLGTVLFGAALAGAWLMGRHARTRSDLARQMNAAEAARLSGQHLAEMSRTLEALVHEVERGSEAQRYTARLLTERVGIDLARSAEDPMRVPERVVTPH